MTLAFHTAHQPAHSTSHGFHPTSRVLLESLAGLTVGVLLVVAAFTGFGVLPLAWLDFAVIAMAWAAICFIASTGRCESLTRSQS